MSEWHFICKCAAGRLDGPGTLTFKATDKEDADQKARDLGWVVDWSPGNYPCVACSKPCWQKSHDEWERNRPAREAARAERLKRGES